jgi:hypothetical protein
MTRVWMNILKKEMKISINKWFVPEHVCKTFRQYYGLNLKICHECHKESPLWEANIIKHQR